MSRRADFVAANPSSPVARITLSYLLFFLIALYLLYPLGGFVANQLHPQNQEVSPTLANFHTLISDPLFVPWLENSILISLVVSITGVALASFAGYAFSRAPFRPRGAILERRALPQLLSAAALLLPFYLILIKLGLFVSYLGLVIIYAATALPFCIWQLKRYYDTIPLSLEEAAAIDGCTRWQLFSRVVLPLAAPALVLTVLFSFLMAWNEFVVAAMILRDQRIFSLPLRLKIFEGNMSTQWGLYASGALLVSVPVAGLFFLLTRFLISSHSSGAVKG